MKNYKELNANVMFRVRYILDKKNIDIRKLLSYLNIDYKSFNKQVRNLEPININHLNLLLEALKLKLNTVLTMKLMPFYIKNEELNSLIKNRIKELNLTMSQFCLVLKMENSKLTSILNCKKEMTLIEFKRICKILGWDYKKMSKYTGEIPE